MVQAKHFENLQKNSRYSTNIIFIKMAKKNKIAVFGGGCFWCTEAIFEELNGVTSVKSGYAGGKSMPDEKTPTYEEVSSGKTGMTEVIKMEYDPEKISYEDLLMVFFYTHDPTTLNKQGADVGEQYRSIIFYADENQKKEAEKLIKELDNAKAYKKPIVTEIKPLENFFEAEDYHQDFYKNNQNKPYCQLVIAPKLEKLRKKFENLLRK